MERKTPTYHEACISCGSASLLSLKGYERHELGRCTNCGLTFILRIPEAHELAAFYSKYSYSQDPWISPITIKRYHEILDTMEPYRSSNRIIDVGCGAGHFLSVAQKRGWEVYGSEFSPAAIKLCEQKGVTMIRGPIHSPEVTPQGWDAMIGTFDIVTSFEVLEHINNPNEDLKAIHRLLRSGGLFYATTPNFNALSRFQLKDKYNVIGYPEHLTYYTRGSLHGVLTQNGLQKLKMVTEGISITRIRKSKNASTELKVGGSNAPDERIREKTENHWFWRLVKRMVNTLFRFTGTGATLKARYLKK